MGRPKILTDIERFLEKVNLNGPVPVVNPQLGNCWLWTAAKVRGYGAFSVTIQPGKYLSVRAHRWFYQHEVGPIKNTLDHLCRIKHCVRPSHLEDVTMAVNNNRSTGYRLTRPSCPKGHSYAEHGRMQNGYPACRVCDTDRHRLRRQKAATNGN